MQILLYLQRAMRRRNGIGVVGRAGMIVVLMVVAAVSYFGLGMKSAFAQSSCAKGARAYTVVRGDTLGAIAARYQTNWQGVASYNHLANPNLIFPGQVLCIPAQGTPPPTGTGVSDGAAVKGHANTFPHGQCTWWADQRYHQLTGIYVPWTTGSNAWQWTTRAHQYHWRVSSKPSRGAIINLQPWVQGAYSLGHVAVVEKVLANGHVIASNMNWGANPSQVTDVEFSPGSGVTFITF